MKLEMAKFRSYNIKLLLILVLVICHMFPRNNKRSMEKYVANKGGKTYIVNVRVFLGC